jgi:phenylpropionate dioxygenase-like ring-hydroxylating dioxygenase large terminal subunit
VVTFTDQTIKRYVDAEKGTMSAEIFSRRDIYEQELEQIFARTWLFVGHVSQIPNPGDYILSRMAEEQVIVTKDRQGKVHVLLNSCRHRGNMVCRYDQGHAFAFQCSFHGWVYNSSGQLVVLPPGSEGDYSTLDKSEWGLLEARCAVFHGSIWACWDKTAPEFLDYLAGAEPYLKNAFLDLEGLESSEEDGGVEVLGAVMKWELGMNWKVPMPDHDATHFWVTHRSQAILGSGVRDVTVNRAGQSDYELGILGRGNNGGGRSVRGGRPGTMYTIGFPEGHTTSLFWPDDLDAPEAESGGYMQVSEYPAIAEYEKGKKAARRKNLGNREVNINEGPHLFPNLGFFGRVIRVLHPQGPDSTEMWSYFIVDKKAPKDAKREYARQFESIYGPSGIVQKDDMENWYILTQYSKGLMTRRTPLNIAMGISRQPLHGPSTPEIGMPGYWTPDLTDLNNRMFYGRWAEYMAAQSWGDLRIENSPK